MKYKLTVLETVEYRHEVIIETDFEIDGLCDYLEDEIDGSSGISELIIMLKHNDSIQTMLTVIGYEEDKSGQSEWEIEDVEKEKFYE